MIYKDIGDIQKDFEYLTSKCTFEYFLLARPSLAKIEEYFLKFKNTMINLFWTILKIL